MKNHALKTGRNFPYEGNKFFVGSFSYVSEVVTSFVNYAPGAYGWGRKIRDEKIETD